MTMNALFSRLDHKRQGTHYSDRMSRILHVCQDCGLLWHEERSTYRNGSSEIRRIDDIEPSGSVRLTAQYEKYGLRVNPRLLPRLRNMGEQFAYALNVPGTSVEIDGNVVYVRVPRPRDERDETITYEQAWKIAPDIPVGSLLLGVDEEQHQLVIELTAPTSVHAAVVGMTGSGKSTLMRTMILSAQMIGGAQVALFDPSGGFRALAGHPSVWRGGLFRTPDECELGLAALARSIGRGAPRLTYVFVDEVPELIMQRPKIKDHLARLAQAGRHAGLHLVIGAQHPLASDLGPMTMRNIPVRLVGRVADTTAAYHATGRRNSGAETLRGRGDFMVVNGGTMQHFQVAYASPNNLLTWARHFPPRSPRLPATVSPARGRPLSLVSSVNDPGTSPGRPPDDIPLAVIQEIRRYMASERRAPSSNWIYRTTREMLPTGGFNRDKARRALEIAMEYDEQLIEDGTSAAAS